jgi:hypothetical protein
MSRFASRLRVGTHVQQGDVIGYVGMTGLATGPHLHYEYLVNGVHKNPQTVQLPGAEPLRAEALQKFLESTAPLLADLPLQRVPSGNAGPLAIEPANAQSLAAPALAAEPLVTEPPPIGVYSVSSILADSLPRRLSIVD